MSNIKTILNQSVKMTVYWILSVVLGFVSNLIYTHYLTPTDFGNFTISRTIVSFLPLVSLFGLHKGLLRQGSFALGRQNSPLYTQIRDFTISFALLIGFGIGILTMIFSKLIAIHIFKNPAVDAQLKFFSVVIPAMVTSNMIMSLYQVNKKSDTGQFLYQVVYFGLLLVIFLIFTLFLQAEPLITWSYFVGHIIYFFVLIFYAKKLGYNFSLKIDKAEKKEIYKISFPQFFSAILSQSQKWMDTIFLGILGTSAEVGIYYITLRMSAFISIPANAINNIFIPIAARLIGQGKHDEVNDLYKTVSRIIFMCGSIAFGGIFFMRTFLFGLFGKGYDSSANVVIIVLISETIDFGVGPARQLITMSGGGKINLINSMVTLTLIVTSSYLLIPRYGIVGAAIANAVTNATLQIITVLELMIIYKLSPFSRQYFVIVGIFLCCILGTAFLPLPDVVKLGIFLFALTGLYLLIVVNKKERKKIKALIAQRGKGKKKGMRANIEEEEVIS